MATNKLVPQIERKAMWFLVNKPNVLNTETVDENWFTNNTYRILASYINSWGGEYTNAEQIAAAFGDTPWGKKLDVQKIMKTIQSIDIPQDAHATFKQLRQAHYLGSLRAAARTVAEEPSEFNIAHLNKIHQEAQQTDNHVIIDASKQVEESINRFRNPQNNFIQTYPGLDRLLGGGLLPNQLMVLGARPSVGKTAFSLNLGMNVLLQNPEMHVEIFSLEMSRTEIMNRIYAFMSGLPLVLFKDPSRMSDAQEKIAEKTAIDAGKLNFWINDSLTTVDQIASVIQQHAQFCDGHYLPIVDHIGIVETGNPKQDTRQSLEEISRRLKLLTQTLKIPILALSQLNRQVEMRQNKEPMLSDLRETGAIEQDANVVAFLWRETEDPNDFHLHLSVKKNRDGELGILEFYFKKTIQKIAEVDLHATNSASE